MYARVCVESAIITHRSKSIYNININVFLETVQLKGSLSKTFRVPFRISLTRATQLDTKIGDGMTRELIWLHVITRATSRFETYIVSHHILSYFCARSNLSSHIETVKCHLSLSETTIEPSDWKITLAIIQYKGQSCGNSITQREKTAARVERI